MKLAFSNLAWDIRQDVRIASVLRQHRFTGVELAPSKVWQRPEGVSTAEARAYRYFWEDQGLEVVALQSLLFGHPNLLLFGNADQRNELADYLRKIIRLGGWLGAQVLVFGSPRNRKRGALSEQQALDIAVPFFRELGDFSHDEGCCLCIEANARQYGCDFVTTVDQAWELVSAVGSPGFGLHSDLGCMSLEGEDVQEQIIRYRDRLKHFHFSRPGLKGFSLKDHKYDWKSLFADYDGYGSVEMVREDGHGHDTDDVQAAAVQLRSLILD